jgi:hypothetical protein
MLTQRAPLEPAGSLTGGFDCGAPRLLRLAGVDVLWILLWQLLAFTSWMLR